MSTPGSRALWQRHHLAPTTAPAIALITDPDGACYLADSQGWVSEATVRDVLGGLAALVGTAPDGAEVGEVDLTARGGVVALLETSVLAVAVRWGEAPALAWEHSVLVPRDEAWRLARALAMGLAALGVLGEAHENGRF